MQGRSDGIGSSSELSPRGALRLLVLSMEFNSGTFSGNGVYAMSQVRALSRLGHNVLVLCGEPAADAPPGTVRRETEQMEGAAPTELIKVALPKESWGRLDSQSGWQPFAEGAASPAIAAAVAQFNPQAVLGVDWHSYAAFLALRQVRELPPYIFMNYRVYLRDQALSEEEREFIRNMEGGAVTAAAATTVLCRDDRDFIAKNLLPEGAAPPEVLLPGLRADLATLPQLPLQRDYLLCCCRCSPEKEPQRFVELVEALAERGTLQRLKLPVLAAGWGADTPYAQELKQRLRAAVPVDCSPLDACPSSVEIMEEFAGPQQMAVIYAGARLNVHPCTYDAYGMTIVEAASQCTPTVVNSGGLIGATDLLKGERGECFELDLSMPRAQLAEEVEKILEDSELLQRVGQAASKAARAWTEAANATMLADLIVQVISRRAE